MVHEEPTLKNIGKEVFASGYLERARGRKKASKTIWDLIFVPLGFGAVGAYWYAFAKCFLWFHLLVYPADATRLDAIGNAPIAAIGTCLCLSIIGALRQRELRLSSLCSTRSGPSRKTGGWK